MSDHFQGIRGFVEAITGRGAYDDAAYNASLNRLMRQRSAQTGLDRQLELLIRDKDINRNRGDADRLIEDDLVRANTLGGTGSDWLASERARGASTQSDAMAEGLAAVMGARESGDELPTDFVNALTGVSAGKLLTDKHVQVQDRSGADLELTQQQLLKAIAGTASEEALTRKRDRANLGGSSKFNLETPTKQQIDEMLRGPDIIEEHFFGADEAFEGPSILDEFTKFQVSRVGSDPRMADASYAIAKFLEFKQAGGTSVAGASQVPQSITEFVRDPSGRLVPSQ